MLNRIWAKNFKAFKRLDYKCAKLNLLTGLNGAGKSSFVQLMLLLRATANKIGNCQAEIDLKESGIAKSFSDIRYCYADKDEQTSFSVDFSGRYFSGEDAILNRASRCIHRIVTGSTSSRCEVLVWHPEAYNKFNDCQIKIQDAMKLYNPEKIDDDRRIQCIVEEIEAQFEKDCKDVADAERQTQEDYEYLWRWMRFIEAFRKRPHEIHETTGMASLNNKQSFSAVGMSILRRFTSGLLDKRFDPEGGDVAEFLYKNGAVSELLEGHPMIHPGTKLHDSTWGDASTLIEQINAWLDEISPGARFCVDRVKLSDDEESYVVKIGFGEESDMQQFKPQNVGLGISYVLPVLATLLTALPDAIIIIENPEAHIHPRGQAKLGELIARAVAFGVQLFVETHSDHVINGVRVAVRDGILKPEDVNISFFERKPHRVLGPDGEIYTEIYSEVNPISVDQNGMLSDYPKGFLDEWDNQLEELM